MELLTAEEKNELRARLLNKQPTQQIFNLLEKRAMQKREENIKHLKDNLNKYYVNLNQQLDGEDILPFGMSFLRKKDLEAAQLTPVDNEKIVIEEE